MIVHILRAKAVGLALGGHHEPAGTAADQSSVGEEVFPQPRPACCGEKRTHPFELRDADDWLVPALVQLSAPDDKPGVKGVRQDLIDGAHRQRHASNLSPLGRSEAPLVPRNERDLLGRVPLP